MTEFFDAYNYHTTGVVTGGSPKLAAFLLGHIRTGNDQLVFVNGHVDEIIKKTFQWFQAYYRNAFPQQRKTMQDHQAENASEMQQNAADDEDDEIDLQLDSIDATASKDNRSEPPASNPGTDSAQVVQNSNTVLQVKKHTPMIELFKNHLREKDWLNGDKVDDQLKRPVTHSISTAIPSGSNASTGKRSASQYKVDHPDTSEGRKQKALRTNTGRSHP
ncbi:hypothetical protein NEOLEDRAFT_1246409 [Neolentinus lepideus HHB14362 ss-1]|uniref:Uncharacterized protein n=1 Tax=Neolentinus lepideus HHB14362 ss-1 TaxID=1314782 RepID=A0A165MLI6_9AGAM|nr:hypothetical protein NEOLEDRAFT_1246409 [Neolentinus lepideus HHB14362 ss-1]